jgi:hypothetical protein
LSIPAYDLTLDVMLVISDFGLTTLMTIL